MAKARIVFYLKEDYDDGYIVEMKIWLLPEPTPERPHGFKYSLFCGKSGSRAVGYDNERGKGDHRHYAEFEEPYAFTSVGQLISDFMSDVDKVRRQE